MSQENGNFKDSELLLEEGDLKISRKKVVGMKNNKQDDRDIQKYAKFDIVSESSL